MGLFYIREYMGLFYYRDFMGIFYIRHYMGIFCNIDDKELCYIRYYIGLYMDTELQLDLVLVEPMPNVDMGHTLLVSDDSKH